MTKRSSTYLVEPLAVGSIGNRNSLVTPSFTASASARRSRTGSVTSVSRSYLTKMKSGTSGYSANSATLPTRAPQTCARTRQCLQTTMLSATPSSSAVSLPTRNTHTTPITMACLATTRNTTLRPISKSRSSRSSSKSSFRVRSKSGKSAGFKTVVPSPRAMSASSATIGCSTTGNLSAFSASNPTRGGNTTYWSAASRTGRYPSFSAPSASPPVIIQVAEQEEKKSNNCKCIVVIILVLLLLAVLVFGAWFVFFKDSDTAPEEQVLENESEDITVTKPEPTPKPQPEPTPAPGPIIGVPNPYPYRPQPRPRPTPQPYYPPARPSRPSRPFGGSRPLTPGPAGRVPTGANAWSDNDTANVKANLQGEIDRYNKNQGWWSRLTGGGLSVNSSAADIQNRISRVNDDKRAQAGSIKWREQYDVGRRKQNRQNGNALGRIQAASAQYKKAESHGQVPYGWTKANYIKHLDKQRAKRL